MQEMSRESIHLRIRFSSCFLIRIERWKFSYSLAIQQGGSMSTKEEKIATAFANPKFKWRTVRGVAKETGFDNDSVSGYVSSHGDDIVKSSARNSKGEILFTSRKKFRDNAGIFSRLSSAMKNRGG